MTVDFVSLLIIVTVSALCPLLADRIPGHIIPETVFLLIAGAVLGPNLLGAFQLDTVLERLSDLGMAFLFLLAGYEINPDMLTGPQGRHGLATWGVTFAIALTATAALPGVEVGSLAWFALAILLTTTAIGALMPILSERGLLGTPVGIGVISYGTWGEICPVIAMVLLLSTRAPWQTIVLLVAQLGLCILIALRASYARKSGSRIYRFLEDRANTTSQTFLRMTIWLLILLVATAAYFNLDIVLGAFAAGFVLRYVIPEGNEQLEGKLEAIGYGFFIPLFFICSGARVDITAVAAEPLTLVLFIVALLFVRAVPIFVATGLSAETRDMSRRGRASIAVYCTTALPLIVAVTTVAVHAGAMDQALASELVAAGAVTVFLMPLLGQLAYNVADTTEVDAVVRSHGPGEEDLARAGRLPLSLRLSVEHLMNAQVPSEDIANMIISKMNLTDGDVAARRARIVGRIDYLREHRAQEIGAVAQAITAEPLTPDELEDAIKAARNLAADYRKRH